MRYDAECWYSMTINACQCNGQVTVGSGDKQDTREHEDIRNGDAQVAENKNNISDSAGGRAKDCLNREDTGAVITGQCRWNNNHDAKGTADVRDKADSGSPPDVVAGSPDTFCAAAYLAAHENRDVHS